MKVAELKNAGVSAVCFDWVAAVFGGTGIAAFVLFVGAPVALLVAFVAEPEEVTAALGVVELGDADVDVVLDDVELGAVELGGADADDGAACEVDVGLSETAV